MPIINAFGGHPGVHLRTFRRLGLHDIHHFVPRDTDVDWDAIPPSEQLFLQDLRLQLSPFLPPLPPGFLDIKMYKCLCLGCHNTPAPLCVFVASGPHASVLPPEDVASFKEALMLAVTSNLQQYLADPSLYEDWFWETRGGVHRVTWMFYLQARPPAEGPLPRGSPLVLQNFGAWPDE